MTTLEISEIESKRIARDLLVEVFNKRAIHRIPEFIAPEKSTPPKVDKPLTGSKIVRPSKEFADAFLNAILPQITEFAPKARLPVEVPVTTNDVDYSQFLCVIDQGNIALQLQYI